MTNAIKRICNTIYARFLFSCAKVKKLYGEYFYACIIVFKLILFGKKDVFSVEIFLAENQVFRGVD